MKRVRKLKGIKKYIALLLAIAAAFISYAFFPEEQPLTGMEVTYLDVGNADCEIIRMEDGTNIVMDAGTKDQEEKMIAALAEKQIEKIDFLIATHPHSDHIGSMERILDCVQVEKVVLPEVVHTSKIYEDMLKKIKAKEIPAIRAEAGVVLKQTEQYKLELVAPQKNRAYESLNDYSAALHITYGDTRFLFTGDAEKVSEEEMSAYEIRADVLKVGHHGSNTSSSEQFIAKVNPCIAVISCGKDNSYGHPHEETLQVLQKAQVYRTDENGDITIHTDGTRLTVETAK